MKNNKIIVSANYRDRDNKATPWLTRPEKSKSAEAAMPTRAVRAFGVVFCASSFEDGWGCSMVAQADGVETHDLEGDVVIPTDAIRVVFTGHHFVRDVDNGNGPRVNNLKVLYLTHDRKMYGVEYSAKELLTTAIAEVMKTEDALRDHQNAGDSLVSALANARYNLAEIIDSKL